MSCSASNSGRRYGIDLRHQVAGQEPEPLARLDRGAGEDDPVDLAAAERGGRQRDREERLAGAGRADPERDRVVADRVDVALLVDGLRRDLGRAVAPDDVLEDPRRRLVLVERPRDRLDRARARSRGPARSARTARGRPPRRPRPPPARPRASARCRAGTRRSRGGPRAPAARRPRCPPARRRPRCRARPALRTQVACQPERLADARRRALAVGAAADLAITTFITWPMSFGLAGARLRDRRGDDRVELGVVELGRQVALDQLRLGLLLLGELRPAAVAELRRPPRAGACARGAAPPARRRCPPWRPSAARTAPAAARRRAASRRPSSRSSCRAVVHLLG